MAAYPPAARLPSNYGLLIISPLMASSPLTCDAAEKRPSRFTGVDRPRRRFPETGIDEPMTRSHGREDPGTDPAPAPCGQPQPPDPAGIDLDLLTRLPIREGHR